MKYFICLVLLFSYAAPGFAREMDSLSIRMTKMMENKEYFSQNKEDNIQKLKQILTIENLFPKQVYDIQLKLYEEYKKYKTDSAIYYVLENQKIADQLGQDKLKQETNLQLVWLYLIKGMYIESKDILENIRKENLPEDLLCIYYEMYVIYYSQYNNSAYFVKSEQYRDSLLLILDPSSLQYRINYAAKMMYSGLNEEENLLSLLNETTDKNPERGLIAYLLGCIHKRQNNIKLSERYFMMSSIADIENCIKENASFLELALIYDEMGKINKAYEFMQAAVEDAHFCNVEFRISKASSLYSSIGASFQKKEKKQKASLQISLLTVSILLVFLAIGIVYIYIQMKRLSHIRKELHSTNLKLSELNNELMSANERLKESNLIKEEYIAHFFDLCSTYIDKLENYRKTLNKHASNRQTEELFKLLRSTSLIDTELEELYKKFDIIFLSLYPTFVEEFNALQLKDEQIVLKQGELLNTELRIFALIRLGITDSMKIAGFLRYSISTIYNYRVKARNNATVPREQFEEMVMKIGNFIKNTI